MLFFVSRTFQMEGASSSSFRRLWRSEMVLIVSSMAAEGPLLKVPSRVCFIAPAPGEELFGCAFSTPCMEPSIVPVDYTFEWTALDTGRSSDGANRLVY